ncbi:MAG: HAMP domain-containing protein [Rhodobacteraceae bacterium]|nr:HAMP domain-containing protein [Paracoccaceae bacterium]
MLSNLKIWIKLPLVMVLTGLIALYLAEFIASSNARTALLEAGGQRLKAVAESRAAEVQAEFVSLNADIEAKYNNPVILDADRAFVANWDEGTQRPSRSFGDVPDPRESPGRGEPGRANEELMTGPHDPGLDAFYDYFATRQIAREYGDVYIIAPNGRVVFSVEKRGTFGQNLRSDPFAGTGLARAFERGLRDVSGDVGLMTDFMPYGPEAGEMSAFVSIGIRNDAGKVEGVLVIRLRAARISTIMARREGLGETGLAAVLGADVTIGGAPEDADFAGQAAVGGPGDLLLDGLDGQGGIWRHGNETVGFRLTAVVPIRIGAFRYVVLAQQEEAEILAPALRLRTETLRDGLWALAFVSVLGVFLARSISIPLSAVEHAMTQIAARDYEQDIPARDRGDEIGDIARRLDMFRASLLEADTTARENAFKSAAFQASSAAMMLVDRNMTIIYVNARLIDLMTKHRIALGRSIPGFHPDGLIGRDLGHLVPGTARLREDLETADQYREDLHYGQARLRLDAAAVVSSSDALLGYVVEWQDVTENRSARILLDAVDGRLPIAGFSPDGRLIDANELFCTWTGLSRSSLAGRGWADLLATEGDTDGASWGRILLSDKERVALRVAPRTRNHARLRCLLFRVPGENGRPPLYILVATKWPVTTAADPPVTTICASESQHP